jgi:predicted phage-related endonuclease
MPTPINISASRGASILGLSGYRTPVQTWLEIMESREPGFCARRNYEMPVFEETAGIRWGKAFESAIIELAEIKQNQNIINREKLFEVSSFNIKVNFLTCHVDGNYDFTSNLHEGKTTSYFYYKDNFGEPGTDKIPQEYQIQCQHQMICTGASKVILSVLVFPRRVEEWEEMGYEIETKGVYYYLKKGNHMSDISEWAYYLDEMGYFHQYEITAHPELQQRMVKHYSDFWNNHVLTGKEPTPQTYDDIKALCPAPVGTILADETVERLMSEYENIKSEISGSGPLAKRAEQIKVSVLDYMRNTGGVKDEESTDKYILRSQDGKKLASYGKNKNGVFIFR